MENDREEWVAKRAYELWERAGEPDGQDHEHWARASAEWFTRSSKREPPSWDEED